MIQFSDLGLAAPLLKALEDEGYTTPTPIQAQAIPAVMAGNDLLGIAQTGTGKTAAFALPILHRLAADRRPAPRKGCRVLVLSPTRELASQIAQSFKSYGRHLNLTVSVVFGGVGHRPQIQALAQGVDVLVATPGRLLDHMDQRDAMLRHTEILVLDEADQMLDLGFVKPIRRIVAQLAGQRQNLFFSATMPKEIAGLADELLRNPTRIAVTPVASTVERISQRVIHVESQKKRALLGQLLSDATMSRTLVFTRTKRGADRVAQYLVGAAGVQAAAIHGNKSQSQRELALEEFRRGRVRVLVATDIAARGIDVDGVSHVVNYELPEVPEAYVHRIGRTARAGADGSAISLCDGEERHLLKAIERLIRQTIPAEDRRGDTTLAVDALTGRRDPERSARAPGRSSSRGPGAGRGEGRGEGRGPGRSGEGRGEGRGPARDDARSSAPSQARRPDRDAAGQRRDQRPDPRSAARGDARNGDSRQPERNGARDDRARDAARSAGPSRDQRDRRDNGAGERGERQVSTISSVAYLAAPARRPSRDGAHASTGADTPRGARPAHGHRDDDRRSGGQRGGDARLQRRKPGASGHRRPSAG